MIATTLTINGQATRHNLPDETLLVELLREHQTLVDLLVKASLLTAGYYNHDRVWRPRRRT